MLHLYQGFNYSTVFDLPLVVWNRIAAVSDEWAKQKQEGLG